MNNTYDSTALTHDPALVGENQPRAWDDGLQQILNDHPVPQKWTRHRAGIPVEARIEWSQDGVERIQTLAFGWTRTLVLIRVSDGRYQLRGAWVPATDVRRRAQQAD